MALNPEHRTHLAELQKAPNELPPGSRGWLTAVLRHHGPDVAERLTIETLLSGREPTDDPPRIVDELRRRGLAR